jgi:hypothetical protein
VDEAIEKAKSLGVFVGRLRREEGHRGEWSDVPL